MAIGSLYPECRNNLIKETDWIIVICFDWILYYLYITIFQIIKTWKIYMDYLVEVPNHLYSPKTKTRSTNTRSTTYQIYIMIVGNLMVLCSVNCVDIISPFLHIEDIYAKFNNWLLVLNMIVIWNINYLMNNKKNTG